MATIKNPVTIVKQGGGGSTKIGDFNILSGKITPDSTTDLITLFSYQDFLAAIDRSSLPSSMFGGVFDPATNTTGFAFTFGQASYYSTPHYRNGSSSVTRGALTATFHAGSTTGIRFAGYNGIDAGKFQAGVEYTWFILWKD